MKLTNIETGKKYIVGAKKIKSDTTEYSRPDGYKRQVITDTYAREGNSKPKPKTATIKKTSVGKSSNVSGKRMAPKSYTETNVREFYPETNKMEPKGPVLTKINPSLTTAKIVKPKASSVEVPKRKPFNKVSNQKYRDEYQVPTGNRGNKPTMASQDKRKGGGKNKLKIGI